MPSPIQVTEYGPFTQPGSSHTGVYLWMCLVSNKVYVGSTTESFKVRKRNHLNSLRRGAHYNRHFQAAWMKYGEEEFCYMEIEACPADKCLEREQYWLDYHQSYDPKRGYNRSKTASHASGFTFEKSDEVKARHKEIMTERYKDPAERKKTSVATRAAYENPDVRAKISKAVREANKRPGIIEKRGQAVRDAYAANPEEIGAKKSTSLKKSWSETDAKTKAKRLSGFEEHRINPELKAKKVEAIKACWVNKSEEEKRAYGKKKSDILTDPEVNTRLREGCKKGCARPEVKARKSKTSKESWADPEKRARRIAGLKAAWARRKAKKLVEQEADDQ